MWLALFGAALFTMGLLNVGNVPLARALEQHDEEAWQRLGRPAGFSFVDLGATLSLFSWVLSGRYSQASHAEVRSLGARAFLRARKALRLMQVGVIILVTGLLLALFGVLPLWGAGLIA